MTDKNINMYEELFINPKQIETEDAYWLIDENSVKKQLAQGGPVSERLEHVQLLLKLYYVENRLSDTDALLEHLADDWHMMEALVGLLLWLGAYCEKQRDYDRAILFYSKGLQYKTADIKALYYLNNNLGFCYNFKTQFELGERFCRAAFEINPIVHNALKNLGVSLEHQGNYIEAANCYAAAAVFAKPDPRPMMHLKRLLKRQPWLQYDAGCRDYVSQAGFIEDAN